MKSTAFWTMLPKRGSSKMELNPVFVTENVLVSFRSRRSVCVDMTCRAAVAVMARQRADRSVQIDINEQRTHAGPITWEVH